MLIQCPIRSLFLKMGSGKYKMIILTLKTVINTDHFLILAK